MNIPSLKILRCIAIALFCLTAGLGICKPYYAYANEGGGEGGGEGEGGKKNELPASKKAVIDGDPGNEAYKGPFIELKQMNVVAIYRGVPVRHMNCVVVVEMEDQEQWKYVLDKVELLRSAFVEELHVIASSQRGALLSDYEFMKKRLLVAANRAIGPGHVKDVLIKATAGRNLPDYYRSQNRKAD